MGLLHPHDHCLLHFLLCTPFLHTAFNSFNPTVVLALTTACLTPSYSLTTVLLYVLLPFSCLWYHLHGPLIQLPSQAPPASPSSVCKELPVRLIVSSSQLKAGFCNCTSKTLNKIKAVSGLDGCLFLYEWWFYPFLILFACWMICCLVSQTRLVPSPVPGMYLRLHVQQSWLKSTVFICQDLK